MSQTYGLWARGDEQKLSRRYTIARCHDSSCNLYDRSWSCREYLLVSLKSSRRHRLFQQFVNVRKRAVSRGLPPLFKISEEMPSCQGDFLFLRPLIASFTSSMVKGCPVLEGHVAGAGGIMPNRWHGLVENRWSYSDQPSDPAEQKCQPGVLCQLRGKGTLSSELGDGFPYRCKAREGHRSLLIVFCGYSRFPSSVRLKNEWDVEQRVYSS